MTDDPQRVDPPPATLVLADGEGRVHRQVAELRLALPAGREQIFRQPAVRVGSHPASDFVVADPTVSRFHLEIEASAAGLLVRDLESTNGTWIDGLRVREAFLPPRATLRLGGVTLRFAITGAQGAIPFSTADEFHGVIGRSPAMREVFALLARAAPSDATVLLEGESGTGKELVAQALHRASPRAGGPFVVVDCAAVPVSLLESELFGHERGAFTGAVARHEGRCREAHGGTLFLDEIGELPLEVQPKLLRVLEAREVRPVGATVTTAVDMRVVAATNRNLAREVNRGTFREDLYYRLAVVQLRLPPLRERHEDVRPLVTHLVQRALRDPRRAAEVVRGVSEANWRRLEALPWPGNVRELRNFIERTLIISGGPIESVAIPAPPAVIGETEAGASVGAPPAVDLDRPFSEHKAEVVARFERAYLLGQLARHEHNVSAAARAAGLDRMNFKRLLQKHR